MKLSCPTCHQTIEIGQFPSVETLNCAHCGATIPISSAPEVNLPTYIPEESEFVPELLASLGQYEILEEISRGGMGIVFKALQRGLNRIVALKMILSGSFAGTEQVTRFYAEAEAAALLDHPGIVPIYEVGEIGNQIYLSMAYLENGTLAKRLQGAPLSYREIASIIQRVAVALQFAHERGIIHRDLKPNNILLDGGGLPVITDFGLAKNLNINTELTLTGQIVGTPAYMPPEQALGESVGPHVDIYSMGATLYTMLTGRPPFHAATPHETLAQLIDRDPIPVHVLSPEVPQDLQTICEKCLRKEIQKRYISAQELADDLGRWLRNEPIQARPVGLFEKLWLWTRRRPAIALFSAAMSGALMLVIILILVIRSNRAEVTQFESKDAWNQYLRQIQLTDRLLLLARSANYTQATEKSDILIEEGRTTPMMSYDLACVYALAMEQVKRDDRLPSQAKHSTLEKLGSKSINALELAWQRGYFQAIDQWESFLQDSDLDSIRTHSDFQALSAKIKASRP